MRWLIILALVVGCTPPAEARVPEGTSTPVPTPSPSPTPFVRASDLTVTVTSFGADELAERLHRELPAAWYRATSGLGRVRIVESKGYAHIILLQGEGRAYVEGGVIRIYEQSPYGFDPMTSAIHELAHRVGCCMGPGTDGEHFIDCEPDEGLMCDPTWAVVTMFSDRELHALNLIR